MAGIKIDFISDVSKFIGGTKDIEGALDKVSDSLDDVAKDADKAGKKIGDELTDGAKDAQDAGEKMERKFRDAFDETKKDAKSTGDKVGDDVKRGFKRAEGAADEFKDEAKSTSREAAASFTGDFEDVSDAIQETLANALAGFGPMGAVAGMAAAAGIGILVSVLQSSADKAAEVKERTIDLAGAIREAGGEIKDVDWAGQFEDFANAIADPRSWFEPWQKASKTNAEVIAADAEKLGLNYQDLFQGLAGDSEAAGRALEDINAKIAEQDEAYQQLVADGVDPAAAAAQTYTGHLETQRDRLEAATEATEDAINLADLYSEAIEGSTAAVEEYNDAQEKRLDLIKEEAELNMSAAEAQAAWAQQVLDNAKAHDELEKLIDTTSATTRDATDAVKDGGTALDLYTEAGQYASKALLDTSKAGWDMIEAAREGGATTEQLEAKTAQAREEFVKQATQMGLTRQAAERLANEYGLIPSSVKTTATFDDSAAQRGIDRFITTNNGRRIRVYVDATGGTSYSTGAGNMSYKKDGGPINAASGVYVTGPGSDIDDRVPAMLSPGEFVLDKQATDQLGVGNLQAALEGIPTGGPNRGQPAPAPVVNVKVYLDGEEVSGRMRVVAEQVLQHEMAGVTRAKRARGL